MSARARSFEEISIIGGCLWLLASGPAAAQVVVWTNAIGGAWNVAGNWNPNQVPGAGQTAYLTNSFPSYAVNVDSEPSAFSALVIDHDAGGTVTLNISDNMDFGGTGFSLTMVNGVLNVLDGGTVRALLAANLLNNQINVAGGGEWHSHNTATRTYFGSSFTIQGNGYARFHGGSNLGMNAGCSLLVEEGGVLEYTGGQFLISGAQNDPASVLTNRGTMDFSGNNSALSLARNSGTLSNIGPLLEFHMESGLLVRRGNYTVNRGILIARSAGDSSQARFTMTGGVVSNAFELTVGVHEGSNASRYADGELLLYGGRWEQGTQLTQIGGYVIQLNVSASNIEDIGRIQGKLTQTAGVFRALGDVFVGNGLGQGTITLSGGEFINTNDNGNALLWLGSRTNITDSVMHHGKGNLILEGGLMTLDRLVATTVVDNVSHSVVQFTGGTLSVGAADVENGTAPLLVGDGTQAATLNLRGATHRFADGVTIKPNARLTVGPPDSVGTAAITGSLTLDPDSRMGWRFTEATSDQATVSGTLSLPSSVTVELTSLDSSTPPVIPLMIATSITGASSDWPRVEVEGVTYRAMNDTTSLWMEATRPGTLLLMR